MRQEVGSKSGYRAFLDNAKADGYLEDISGNIEDAKVRFRTVNEYDRWLKARRRRKKGTKSSR